MTSLREKHKDGSITLIPFGGLGNRMQAITSAYWASKLAKMKTCTIIWFKDKGLNACFNEIFLPIKEPNFIVKEATLWDVLTKDRARKHNLWLPTLPIKLNYDRHLCSKKIFNLYSNGFNFVEWMQGKKCHIESCLPFMQVPPTLYAKLFKPQNCIIERINLFCQSFSMHTIGMHIRRTDHVKSITYSPTILFIEAGKIEIERHKDTKIFLATDSEEEKAKLIEVFGDRIITAKTSASRNNLYGIQNAIAEMYTLSRTKIIYGSSQSTFSTMASMIGQIPLQTLDSRTL